jgi:hypothetical protein
LFEEGAGDYTNAAHAKVLLVEKVEAMMSQENSGWMAIKEHGNANKA